MHLTVFRLLFVVGLTLVSRQQKFLSSDFTFRLSLSLSQFAERNLKLNAKVPT